MYRVRAPAVHALALARPDRLHRAAADRSHSTLPACSDSIATPGGAAYGRGQCCLHPCAGWCAVRHSRAGGVGPCAAQLTRVCLHDAAAGVGHGRSIPRVRGSGATLTPTRQSPRLSHQQARVTILIVSDQVQAQEFQLSEFYPAGERIKLSWAPRLRRRRRQWSQAWGPERPSGAWEW